MRSLKFVLGLSVLGCVFFLVSSVAMAQVNDKCTNAMIKDVSKLDQTQGKFVTKCVKDIGKGKRPAAESCLTDDPKGKITKKKDKIQQDYDKKCEDPIKGITPPGFGPGSGNYPVSRLQAAGMAKNLWLTDLVFGADIGLAGRIVDCNVDKPGCKCQQAVIKDLTKIEKTKLKECTKGVKSDFKLGSITDAASLSSSCIGAITADVKGKIAKTETKLDSDIQKKCLTNPFIDGMCTGLSSAGANSPMYQCLAAKVECEVCLYLKNTGQADSSVDCDLFDNGAADGSCCKLMEGSYTLTQTSGGSLTVDGLPAFPFPAGGTIVQDVGPAGPGCVHSTVVPSPGGFAAPTFCIPALGFSTSVVQTACGIGQIDDDGGSDYTITEVTDTSAPASCLMPASSCPPPPGDSNVRVDVGVGDGSPDTCTGASCSNAIVSIPVFTTTWVDNDGTPNCPDEDGVFDGADILVVSFPQILDFTTDQADTYWSDLEADGCFLSGAGPAGGFTLQGTCLDPLTGTVFTVAAGGIGSNGAPLYDLSYATALPNIMTGPGAPLGSTCATPPLIALGGGTVSRCIP